MRQVNETYVVEIGPRLELRPSRALQDALYAFEWAPCDETDESTARRVREFAEDQVADFVRDHRGLTLDQEAWDVGPLRPSER